MKIYENKPLSLQQMKSLASVITQKFAQEKFRAYIPKQSFTDGTMYINLIAADVDYQP